LRRELVKIMNEKELQDGLYHYLYLNNDEYRWCRNKKDRKRWFRKNKLTDEWEYVSFLGDYHTELMFYYCIYCGVKSARLC